MEPENGLVKVLYVNGNAMDRGGIEAFLMNYYRHIDRSKVQCDFIVHGAKEGIYNQEIEKMGGKIYHVPTKSKHPFQYTKELKKIFNSGEYRIVHSHLDAMNCWVLKVAMECGIPVRIAHCHNTRHLTNNKIKFLINEYARKNITKYATHFFACSDAAGRWLFGKAWGHGNSQILHNAIDFGLYGFNPGVRKQLRQLYDVNNDFIIGHVGRFSYQKNHMYLLEMIARLKKIQSNVKLLLIGDGENRKEIEKKIVDLGISKSVLLMGSKSNVYDYYNMMDLFVLPSRFEGLPVVAIEAQANGLTCFVSQNVTKEVCITENVKMISINNINDWVTEINRFINRNSGITRESEKVTMNSYNINIDAKKLESFYLSCIN